MLSDSNDILIDYVASISRSDVFHILARPTGSGGYIEPSNCRSICSGIDSRSISSDDILHLEEAIHDERLHLCTECLNNVRRLYVPDVKECICCSSMDILMHEEFKEVEIHHRVSGDTSVHVCSECANSIAE